MTTSLRALQKKRAGLAAIEKYQQPAIRQIDKFARDLGRGDVAAGREVFLSLVSIAAVSDERLDDLLAALHLEEAAGRTLGEVVAAVGLRPGEVLKIVRDAALTVAQASSMAELADHLPAITRDVAIRAQVHYLPCGACGATGRYTPAPTKEDPDPEEEVCRTCRGKTTVRVEADLERQQLALEMGKLLPKGGGTNIAIQTNVGGGAGASAAGLFSRLVRATDQILHQPGARPTGRAPREPELAAVDAVVVESPAPIAAAPEEPAPDAERS